MQYYSKIQQILPDEKISNLPLSHKNNAYKIGSLWIGGLSFIHKLHNPQNQLKQNKITAICSALSTKISLKANPEIISHLQIDIEDFHDEDIHEHLEKVYQFIQDNRNQGRNVLVHCVAGMSRSAAFIVFYLMKKFGISYVEAYERVERVRPIIKINHGFEQILKALEHNLIEKPRL